MRGILTYHAIDRTGSPISVTPEAFRSHVAWLTSGAVRVVPLLELVQLPDEENAVAITFDDALESVATEAAPVLAAHGLPATIFVVSGRVGGDNRWSGEADPGIPVQPLLDWGALERLLNQGLTIGAHSRSHRNLRGCGESELADEIEGSANDIARALGERPTAFAYPYGAFAPRVSALVAETFNVGCTTTFLPATTGMPLAETPRLDAWYFRDAARLSQWGTPSFARWVAFRHALRRLRRLIA